MPKRITPIQPFTLLKTSFNVLVSHPIVLAPLIIAAFFHFFILEILYFIPRFPLSVIFAPIIRDTAGEMYLHYPYNFILMSNWYYAVQVPIYILFNGYFLAVSIVILQKINNSQTIDMRVIYQRILSRYFDIFFAALLSAGALMACNQFYVSFAQEWLIAQFVNRTEGLVNQLIIGGSVYLNLILAVLVTTLFAFVIPIIALEDKGIWPAIKQNFKMIKDSFWFIFFILLFPYLLYIPFLLLRMNASVLDLLRIPDLMGIVLALSVCVMLVVEATQYTIITLYYLLRKETA